MQERAVDGGHAQNANLHIALAQKDAEIDNLKKALASATVSVSAKDCHSSEKDTMPIAPDHEDNRLQNQVIECDSVLVQRPCLTQGM